MFSEQAMFDVFVRIQFIQQRIRVFGQTGCEDHDLKHFANIFKELVHTRSLAHIDSVYSALEVQGDYKVGVRDGRERTVYECLVQIKHQAFLAFVSFGDRRKQPFFRLTIRICVGRGSWSPREVHSFGFLILGHLRDEFTSTSLASNPLCL
jgi:hypothetical protein